jgi:hypothetical protein
MRRYAMKDEECESGIQSIEDAEMERVCVYMMKHGICPGTDCVIPDDVIDGVEGWESL